LIEMSTSVATEAGQYTQTFAIEINEHVKQAIAAAAKVAKLYKNARKKGTKKATFNDI